MGASGSNTFCAFENVPISSELRRNGSTVTPAAPNCAISASTITFSPEGWPEAYRLCATTTFMMGESLRTPR